MRVFCAVDVIKANESLREITGVATTTAVDVVGDIVEAKGAEFSLPIPALWQHRNEAPVGWVTSAKVTDESITATIKLAQISEAGALRDRLEEVWQSVRIGLVTGLSIGFRSIESVPLPNGARRFKRWRWHELSLVTLAANPGATITAIKGTRPTRVARSGVVYLNPPGPRPGVIYLDSPASRQPW